MLLGVLLSAISGGATALAVSFAHGGGVVHAFVSYPLGGMMAIMAFVAMSFLGQNTGRS